MPAIVIRFPDGTEQEQELAEQLTVGRAEGNDLVLAEGGVSRKHARFFLEGADVLVEDTGSANGTFIDGAKIEGPTKIGPRAQVVIGDYEIKLKGNGAANGKPRPSTASKGPVPVGAGGGDRTTAQKVMKPARATTTIAAVKRDPAASSALARRTKATASPSAGAVLRGLTGPFMNKSFPVKGTMVVGRVAGVDIQLEDDSVSRRHAEVVMQGKSVVLRDLGSANGTTVNGQPLSGEVPLNSGDIIQFGVVEMAYENGAAEASPSGASNGKLARRPGGPPARAPMSGRGRRGAAESVDDDLELSQAGLDPKKKKMLLAAGGVLTLVVVAVVVLAFKTPAPGPDVNPAPGPKGPIINNLTAEQQIEEYLSQCRQFSSIDLGEPNWEKAESACKKVLDLEPIHPEANQLLARIKIERKCEDNFNKAKKQLSRLRDEEALDALKEITSGCSYYIKAFPLVKEAFESVKKRVGEECKQYSNNGKLAEALQPCERYMSFACQSMKPDELYPPAMKQLCLSGGGRNCWRPKDAMYMNLLRAREKNDPKAAPWKCERITIYPQENNEAKTIHDQTKNRFAELYKGKELSEAITLYYDGKAAEAVASLQNRVENNIEKAAMHADSKNMRKQMTTVEQLFKDGQGELGNNRPDKAAEPFTEALQIDEILVLGEKKAALPLDQKKKDLEKTTSYYRRNIQQDMASASYARGKDLMDRQDRRQACKIWKLGFAFWKGNSDLLRAVTNVCTQEAARRLEAAGSCEDLAVVLEFAVDGDGHKEQVEKKQAELNCTPP
jgi:pSer/pThr/pTyr-binding forkhead associated (FHA) protein